MKYAARWLFSLALSPGVMFLWLYLGLVNLQEHILIPRLEATFISQFSSNDKGIAQIDIDFSNRALLWGNSLKWMKIVFFKDSLFFVSEPFEIRPLTFQEVVFATQEKPNQPINKKNSPIRFFPINSPQETINFNPSNRVNRVPPNSREDSLLSAAWRNLMMWNEEVNFLKGQLRLIKRKS